MAGFPGNRPLSLGALQKSPHPHNPSCGGTGLLSVTRHSFHLYGSGTFSGIEDTRPNIITKKYAPMNHTAQEMPRVLGAVRRELGWRPNTSEKYILVIEKCIFTIRVMYIIYVICIFLINHKIIACDIKKKWIYKPQVEDLLYKSMLLMKFWCSL